MKKLLLLVLSTVLVFSLAACGSSSDSESSEPESSSEPAEEVVIFAEDEVVNQFIIDYNAITESEFSDISEGNIRTKYYAYSYGYYCELLHANDTDKIHVAINETNDNADDGVAGMKGIFHDVAITIDSTLSDDEINAFFDDCLNNDVMVEDSLGSISILFVPDKDLSAGHSRGHIELSAN